MPHKKTIYIWDGGVFSPPTRAVGQLAFNIATYISSKFDNKFQIAILNQKRKLHRKEFASVIHGLTLLMVSLRNGNYSI